MVSDEIGIRTKRYSLGSWKSQQDWNPIAIKYANGVFCYDLNEKQYLDWGSQVVNVNLGHSHPRIVKKIREQVEKLTYVSPSYTSESRAEVGEILADLTPSHLNKSFLTTGGSDAIENAIKIARLYTGKRKIITRYRSYHGATYGAMSVSGDPRRLANEPGIDSIVRFHYSAIKSSFEDHDGRVNSDKIVADVLEQTILFEGPEYIAAIILEGYSGSSGILQPPEEFWKRVQDLCNKYAILLIIDEVMSGFGRTGKWFGFNHYPFLKPDIVCFAKGLTSGYIPLGGLIVSDKIAEHFQNNVLWAGLTHNSHVLGCAVAAEVLKTYKEDKLVDNAFKQGVYLKKRQNEIMEEYNSIFEVRGTGLLQLIEFKDKLSKIPISEFNKPLTKEMLIFLSELKDNKLLVFSRWNWLYSTPPLIITEQQIDLGVDIIENTIAKNFK